MMEPEEYFHELHAAVKEYYANKINSIKETDDVELYYTFQSRESELLSFIKATRRFLEWGNFTT